MLGAAVTLPDVNQVLAKMNGRLLPFGWLTFLRAMFSKKGVNTAKAGSTGCGSSPSGSSPSTSTSASPPPSTTAASRVGKSCNQPRGETGWILEVNKPMNRAMEGMGGKVVKKLPALREGALAPGVVLTRH